MIVIYGPAIFLSIIIIAQLSLQENHIYMNKKRNNQFLTLL